MLTWLACGSQGTVPPPWELPPASLTPLDSLTSPETPSGGNPASCPKYAASVQRELEQLKAQLKAQREQYAQLQDETARLRSDASAYYRKEAAKQMLTCDCAQCQSGSPPPKPNPNQVPRMPRQRARALLASRPAPLLLAASRLAPLLLAPLHFPPFVVAPLLLASLFLANLRPAALCPAALVAPCDQASCGGQASAGSRCWRGREGY